MNAQTGVTAASRKRGAYAKSEQTRTTILDAALEVFAESGYRSGSIKEVAMRVGMSEAGLLHHFPNKSALLAAVLDRRDQHSYDFVPLDAIDGRAAVRGLVALARYNASQPGVVELYCTLSAEATAPDHPAHEYFLSRYEWTRQKVEENYRKLEVAGDLAPGVRPLQAAISTIAMMDGLQVQWLLHPDALDMADELHKHISAYVTFEL